MFRKDGVRAISPNEITVGTLLVTRFTSGSWDTEVSIVLEVFGDERKGSLDEGVWWITLYDFANREIREASVRTLANQNRLWTVE